MPEILPGVMPLTKQKRACRQIGMMMGNIDRLANYLDKYDDEFSYIAEEDETPHDRKMYGLTNNANGQIPQIDNRIEALRMILGCSD